jgi:hypothetical protein
VHEPPTDLEQLRETLLEMDDAIRSNYADAVSWHLRLGPIDVRRHVSSNTVFWLYTLVNAVLFASGTVMSFAHSPLRELGIAVTVGAIFALCSFLSQLWGFAVQREQHIIEPLFGNAQITHLRQLLKRRESLARRIAGLDEPAISSSSSAHVDSGRPGGRSGRCSP